MQHAWLQDNRSQQPRELKSCGGVYFRAPQGFSSAVRVLNLSITVGDAEALEDAEGEGVTHQLAVDLHANG